MTRQRTSLNTQPKTRRHMAKLERGQITINDVGRKFGLSKHTISSAGKQFKSAR